VRESATANNIMVTIKLLVIGLFIIAGLTHINTATITLRAHASEACTRRGDRVLRLYRIRRHLHGGGNQNRQRNCRWDPRGLAICTVIYVIVGAV